MKTTSPLKIPIWGLLALVSGGVALAAVLLKSSSEQSYRMPNHSMAPTIEQGDRVRVDSKAYAEASPQVGDLAVFVPRDTPNLKWIFRVAAVAGDTVSYQDDILCRNGAPIRPPPPLDDMTFSAPGRMKKGVEITFPYRLSENDTFLLSDDPEHRHDSRFWGLVQREDIVGKVSSHE